MMKYIYIFKEIMLTIYPLTLWSQNVLTKNFWSKMKVSKVAKIRNRYNQVPHLTQELSQQKNQLVSNILK